MPCLGKNGLLEERESKRGLLSTAKQNDQHGKKCSGHNMDINHFIFKYGESDICLWRLCVCVYLSPCCALVDVMEICLDTGVVVFCLLSAQTLEISPVLYLLAVLSSVDIVIREPAQKARYCSYLWESHQSCLVFKLCWSVDL